MSAALYGVLISVLCVPVTVFLLGRLAGLNARTAREDPLTGFSPGGVPPVEAATASC